MGHCARAGFRTACGARGSRGLRPARVPLPSSARRMALRSSLGWRTARGREEIHHRLRAMVYPVVMVGPPWGDVAMAWWCVSRPASPAAAAETAGITRSAKSPQALHGLLVSIGGRIMEQERGQPVWSRSARSRAITVSGEPCTSVVAARVSHSAGCRAVLLRHVAEIPRRRRTHEVAEVTHDARFGVALGRCIVSANIDQRATSKVAARRILVQGRWGLRHVRPVELTCRASVSMDGSVESISRSRGAADTHRAVRTGAMKRLSS